MKEQIQALKAEFIKNKYANILWVTFVAFALAPLMGGIFMLVMRNPEAMANAGALNAKMQMMNLSPDWNAYFGILTQAIGVGGVLIFGFVASWIFGREYVDGTAKDLLALPISRAKIIHAKFVIYLIWCVALVISNLLLGLIIGTILQITSIPFDQVFEHVSNYLNTTILTVMIGTPIAFFTIWSKGYLAPLGFVSLTLVFSQIIAAVGYGYYFPWAIPGLYSGAGGEFKAQLNEISYGILILTSIIGYWATVYYWKYADQTK